MNAFADWMSLAVIAVNRCLLITNPDACSKMHTKRNLIIIIASIWIYAFILLIPVISGVQTWQFETLYLLYPTNLSLSILQLGAFAYNCRLGICGFHSRVKHLSEIYFYGIGFFMPTILSAVSYTMAWIHIRRFKPLTNSMT